jgi:putative endonuclease
VGGYAYTMASGPHGTLYVGVTNDIAFRAWQHKTGQGSAFCRRYGVTRLVHYEVFEDIGNAIRREKRIKAWPRRWKINPIEQSNPRWDDLYETLNQ